LRSFSFDLGGGGEMTRHVIGTVLADPRLNNCCRQVVVWLYA
jgi:hypothetical protein